MKKYLIFTKLIMMLILVSNISKAEVLIEENFNYTVGDSLKKCGFTTLNTGASITIAASSLIYNGYASSGIGSKIYVAAAGIDYYKTFTPTIPKTGGTVYMAFLANFTSASSTADYFMTFASSSTYFFGRLYAKTDGSKLAFAINRGSKTTATTYTGFNYDFNTTYLIVIKYILNSVLLNDSAKLFINPVIGSPEPIATIINTDASTDPSSAIDIILIRQGTTTPVVAIDGIRVGITWNDVVASGAPITTPIFLKEKYPTLVFDADKLDTVSVKVTPNNNSLDSVILYEDNVRINKYLPNTTDSIYRYIKTSFTAGNCKAWFNVHYNGSTTPAFIVDTLRYTVKHLNIVSKLIDLYSLTSGDYAKYTGDATVNYVYAPSNKNFYIQDSTSAFLLYDNTNTIKTTYNEGDKVKNLFGSLALYNGVLELVAVRDSGKVVSSGNSITPKEIAFSEYKTNSINYKYQLIKIKELQFKATGTFADSKNYGLYATLASDTIIMRTFNSAADYITQAIPTVKIDIIAIASYNSNAPVLYVRKNSEIQSTPTSVETMKMLEFDELIVTPNPVLSSFTLNIESDAKVSIYSIVGQLVKEVKYTLGKTVDISDLPTGKYIVNCKIASKNYSKIIVKK